MNKKNLLILFSFVLILISSCTKKSEQAKVEMVDGVQFVHNPATPLFPNKKVMFEEELSIGGEEEGEEIVLYQPSRLAVDDQGNIYVSDLSENKIKVFDRTGNYLRSIGNKGQGPGEFGGIGYLAFCPDGKLLVTDFRNRRTSILKPNGEFLSSYTWKNYHYSIFITTDSTYTCSENVFEKEGRKLFVKTYDFQGKEIVNFGEFKPADVKILRQGNMAFGISVPYSPESVFAGDQQRQWLYHCFNSRYLIEVYDNTGKIIRKIDRPYQPLPFTEKDAEEYRHGFDKNPNKVFAQMAKDVELPKIKTIIDFMIVDDKGNLWIRTNEEKTENDDDYIAYDIFNKNGIYEAKVWCNVRPRIFKNGKMYTIVTDKETDVPVVKRYNVVWTD